MPTYILLSLLTPEGSQTLHKDPERRSEPRDPGVRLQGRHAVRCSWRLRFRDNCRRTG